MQYLSSHSRYSVVGVLEEMDKSMAVLEAYLPQFFRGARKLSHQFSTKHNATPHPKLDNKTRHWVHQHISYLITYFQITIGEGDGIGDGFLLVCFTKVKLSDAFSFFCRNWGGGGL